LHLSDTQRLPDSLNALVDSGNMVVVIKHHLAGNKTAGWVIDLGPEGDKHGGTVVAQGTPEDGACCQRRNTGLFLPVVLGCGQLGSDVMPLHVSGRWLVLLTTKVAL